jgi:hypothetical protein
MIDVATKNEYWAVVEDCLVILHAWSREQAQKACKALRKKMEKPPQGLSGEIFYHNEPFNAACDMGGTQLPYKQVIRAKYEQILNSHQW